MGIFIYIASLVILNNTQSMQIAVKLLWPSVSALYVHLSMYFIFHKSTCTKCSCMVVWPFHLLMACDISVIKLCFQVFSILPLSSWVFSWYQNMSVLSGKLVYASGCFQSETKCTAHKIPWINTLQFIHLFLTELEKVDR